MVIGIISAFKNFFHLGACLAGQNILWQPAVSLIFGIIPSN
jgi:hypothetical protein